MDAEAEAWIVELTVHGLPCQIIPSDLPRIMSPVAGRDGRVLRSTLRRCSRWGQCPQCELFSRTTSRRSSSVVHLLWHLASSCDEGFDIHRARRCTRALQGLRIDPRRLMSKLFHVLNVRPRINSGMAVDAALAPQFQHT